MGYYINELNGKTLPAKGKVPMLLEAGAIEVEPQFWCPDLVCVVDNGSFEAAGFCYSREEFEAFADPRDTRPKTWLIVPGAAAIVSYNGKYDNPFKHLQRDQVKRSDCLGITNEQFTYYYAVATIVSGMQAHLTENLYVSNLLQEVADIVQPQNEIEKTALVWITSTVYEVDVREIVHRLYRVMHFEFGITNPDKITKDYQMAAIVKYYTGIMNAEQEGEEEEPEVEVLAAANSEERANSMIEKLKQAISSDNPEEQRKFIESIFNGDMKTKDPT